MAAAALVCAVTAALTVSTDRSQYFVNDGFIVTCPSDSWTVQRETRLSPSPSPCRPPWGKPLAVGCRVGPTQRSHSGKYWCENKDKAECTAAINITVSDRTVVLASPLFPVTEGQNVTLTCFYRQREEDRSTSEFEAVFFRNGAFLGRFSRGKMVLSPVSKDDEGLYKCEHTNKDQSLESRLIVLSQERTSAAPSVSPSPSTPPVIMSWYRLLCFAFLFLLYTTILCIGLSVYCKWARARDEDKKPEPQYIAMRKIRNS